MQRIEGPPGTFGFNLYSEEEFQAIRAEEEAEDSAIAAAWQYHDEIEYQSRMAISYPQDAQAIFANNWLTTQGI